MDSLPEDYHEAVVLSDLEGLPYKEIAEILDIPIGTVMSRLHRGEEASKRDATRVCAEARLFEGLMII